jgi:chromosome partitioning protein
MIITIAHQKGGVGKSTITFNLAYYLSKYKPLLVDLDIQNTISHVNRIREKYALKFNIVTITSDDTLKNIIKTSDSKNLILIDTGGFDSSLTRMSITASDLVLVPLKNKTYELLGLLKFEGILEELSKIKKSIIKAKIILTRVNPSVKDFSNIKPFIEASPYIELMESIIRARAEIEDAQSKGLTVGEYANGSKGDLEFKKLATEINRIIYK